MKTEKLKCFLGASKSLQWTLCMGTLNFELVLLGTSGELLCHV